MPEGSDLYNTRRVMAISAGAQVAKSAKAIKEKKERNAFLDAKLAECHAKHSRELDNIAAIESQYFKVI